ncbi:MAG: hypothetical protein K2X50_05690 [Gammaproteobacteria bacterium]|nr:hypothetical protein [Gammaproteobacteria bacterium]
MRQKKSVLMDTPLGLYPTPVVMEDGTAEKPMVVIASDEKIKLEAAIKAFYQCQEFLEDAIRVSSESIESLKDHAKLATVWFSNVKIALLNNSVEELSADAEKSAELENHLNGCADFMAKYIAALQAQQPQVEEIDLDANVPAAQPVNHGNFMDSAFANKAIGLAGIVLGAITALLGALATAVSLGAITTVVLAPAGVIGVNAGAGMVSGGVTALAFGVGFFAHGRNLSHKAAQELPLEDQFYMVAQD